MFNTRVPGWTGAGARRPHTSACPGWWELDPIARVLRVQTRARTELVYLDSHRFPGLTLDAKGAAPAVFSEICKIIVLKDYLCPLKRSLSVTPTAPAGGDIEEILGFCAPRATVVRLSVRSGARLGGSLAGPNDRPR